MTRVEALSNVQGHQSLEQLKGNMREEHVLKLDWISTIFNHVRCSALAWSLYSAQIQSKLTLVWDMC